MITPQNKTFYFCIIFSTLISYQKILVIFNNLLSMYTEYYNYLDLYVNEILL